MDVLKKHLGQIFFAVFVAVLGVLCGVLPYFAMAKIVEHIAAGKINFMIYKEPILIILCGLLGSVIFHEI